MSLTDLEQNDVDISSLFAYKKEITLLIPGTSDEITLYQRIIGDADNNRARVYALRESSNLRANLRDSRWEDRTAFIPDFSKLLKEDLIEVVLSLMGTDLSIQAINNTTLKQPKKPSGDASLEEQEEYQTAIDEWKKEFNLRAAAILEELTTEARTNLRKQTKDNLRTRYESELIDRHCQERFGKAYLDIATYMGTFTDASHTKRAFKSLEDFLNAPTNLKDALAESYGQLQVGGVALKKSQGVMR